MPEIRAFDERRAKTGMSRGLDDREPPYFFLPARRAAQYFFIRADTALRCAAVHVARRRRRLTGSAELISVSLAPLELPFNIAPRAARSRLISANLTVAPSFAS
jgi:hypothetical protein